ncbi:MAG TPA: ATP-binding cassette domain-containing protein [Allosphingosinicella sp.]
MIANTQPTSGTIADAAIELRDVNYAYPGSARGVRGVSLLAEPGTIYGLLGVNGAGKTTLMRLMLGLLSPDGGSVRYFGDENVTMRERLAAVGSLIETPSLYAHLTAHEHLKVFACYTGASEAAVARALELTGIIESADRIVRQFSLGMKQRLALATALLHDPPILLLDEPTNGLDPAGIAAMRGLILRLAELGKTIILSSHLLSEVEKTATRIGIIHEGSMRFQGTAEALSRRLGATLSLRLRLADPDGAARVLTAAGMSSGRAGGDLDVAAADDHAAAQVLRVLTSAGFDVFEAVRDSGSLERDFLSLTQGEADAR